MGKADNRIFQGQEEQKPFNAVLRVAGLYDSRVDSAADNDTDDGSDSGLVFRLGASYQFPATESLGVRIDYSGNAQFYRCDGEDFLDNTLSLVPQYFGEKGLFTLPVSIGYAVEEGDSDYYRYAVSPTYTYFLSGASAIAAYATLSAIDDVDEQSTVDEDGLAFGGGLSYYTMLTEKTRVRISIDYTAVRYDSYTADYVSDADPGNRREDSLLTAGLDVQWQVNRFFGLFSSYSFIHSSSNVDVNDYDRSIVELGVVFMF